MTKEEYDKYVRETREQINYWHSKMMSEPHTGEITEARSKHKGLSNALETFESLFKGSINSSETIDN